MQRISFVDRGDNSCFAFDKTTAVAVGDSLKRVIFVKCRLPCVRFAEFQGYIGAANAMFAR